jgi:hypothetical protein
MLYDILLLTPHT